MDLARYFVMQIGDRWFITLDGQPMSSYATRSQAVSAAVIMADLMGAMHHDADVMVDMGHGLPLELVWSYGRDEVPAPRVPLTIVAPDPQDHLHVRQVQHGEAA